MSERSDTAGFDGTNAAPAFAVREIEHAAVRVRDDAGVAAQRYAGLSDADRHALREFSQAMEGWIASEIPQPGRLMLRAYGHVMRRFGKNRAESDWMAEQGGIGHALMAAIQRLYTLSHAVACSTLCYREPGGEMVCLRSLDWPGAEDIAKATRVFEHRHGTETSHYSVGPVGMLGALTAVRPGAFSAVINWAPSPWGFLGVRIGTEPTFALRELMERRPASYADAVAAARGLNVSSPVFLTFCGAKAGEACVIELGTGTIHVREIGDRPCLVQTNHYDPDGPNGRYNVRGWNDTAPRGDASWYGEKLPRSSRMRQRMVEETVTRGEMPWRAYERAPVWNHECAYWAEMRPARTDGDGLRVWTRASG